MEINFSYDYERNDGNLRCLIAKYSGSLERILIEIKQNAFGYNIY